MKIQHTQVSAAAYQLGALALGPQFPALSDPRQLRKVLDAGLATIAASSATATTPAAITAAIRSLSPAEAATRASVHRRTILNWVAAGMLPARRIGHRTVRILESDLVNFLATAGVSAALPATTAPAAGNVEG